MIINLLASWQDLLGQFDLTTIIFILLLAFFAYIEISKGIDYFRDKRKKKNKDDNFNKNRLTTLEKEEKANEANIETTQQTVEKLRDSIDLLIESDKCDIKAWITEKYHYYMQRGEIDDFTLDSIERRFACYKKVGGNSYVEELVQDLRKLKRTNSKK